MQRFCHEADYCAVFPVDIDSEAGDEYVVLLGHAEWYELFVFAGSETEAWRFLGEYQFAGTGQKPDSEAIREAIHRFQIETRPPPYSDLAIDGRRFRLNPR